MPRGPGKKENYNFDYSRFNGVQGDEAASAVPGPEAEGGLPADLIKQLPGELQEAFRLMQISKQTGDLKAQERANELALKAVERGGPEMKQRFQQELMRQAAQSPETKSALEAVLGGASPALGAAAPAGVAAPAAGTPGAVASEKLQADGRRMEDLSKTIDDMQRKFKTGQEQTSKQLDAMKRQQETLENLKSPDEFLGFMASQGITPEDLEKAMSGDETHMRSCFERSLGKTVAAESPPESDKLDAMLSTVDQIHKELGGDLPDLVPPPAPVEPPPAGFGKKEARKPAAAEPKIPQHRVQYQKDDSGRLTSVELHCDLPGVQSMADIEVDVSEKYLRLRTLSPAYVVNVGPFTNLVEATAARAKFSKKRHELSLTVPAKV